MEPRYGIFWDASGGSPRVKGRLPLKPRFVKGVRV